MAQPSQVLTGAQHSYAYIVLNELLTDTHRVIMVIFRSFGAVTVRATFSIYTDCLIFTATIIL